MNALKRGRLSWVLACGLIAPCVLAKPAIHRPDPPKDDEAQATEAALAVLKRADNATKAVKLIRYDAQWKGTGWAENRTWKLQGTVIASKETDDKPQVFLIVMTAQAPGSSEERGYTVGSDGTNFFMIDSKEKLVYEDSDRRVMGQGGRIAQALAMIEFVHATPFTDELTGQKALLLGTETVGGEECDHVFVVYAKGQEAEWYFSKRDNLPRRVDRIVKNTEGEKAKRILSITNLVVDPQLPEDTFKAKVPEGFKKTDELAPGARIPM
ncbi:MAG: DUF2092 domain-containing protein [Planctomycetes bacterium]|nr:DUF2092 domain-containing protein [Planctomycetota bacterium]